jgi:hypothetical protein
LKRPLEVPAAPGDVLVVGVVALAFVLVEVELDEELPHAVRTMTASTARTTAVTVVRLLVLPMV